MKELVNESEKKLHVTSKEVATTIQARASAATRPWGPWGVVGRGEAETKGR